MASNNALQVNEGLQGDPPYLTRKDVKEDEDYAKIVAVLPSSLMGEALPPLGLFKEWKQLGRAVRSFAFYIMEEAERRPWGTLSAKTREKLLGIAPTTAKRFWDDDYDGDILITAWIWRIITDDILCNPRRYDTPVWEAFGTLDAALSRRAGTLDGAIHPRPLSSLTTSNKNDEHSEVRDTSPLIDTLNPGTGTNNKNHEHDEVRHTSPLIGTLNPGTGTNNKNDEHGEVCDTSLANGALNRAFGGHGNLDSYLLEYRYHQWRALTYGMLRRDEAVPHASPDRLARAIVKDVTAAFDFDQDSLDGTLETTAAKIAALAVEVDRYLLIATGNSMVTYRLPGRTEGDIIGHPFRKSAALHRCNGALAEGRPIDMVVAPGIFSTGILIPTVNENLAGNWVGSWSAPIQVCVDHYNCMSAESVPATNPERGESTAGPRTRKRARAEAAEEKENTASGVQEEENTRAKGRTKPKSKPKRKAATRGRRRSSYMGLHASMLLYDSKSTQTDSDTDT